MEEECRRPDCEDERSVSNSPFFDQSLPRLVQTIIATLGAEALDDGVVLRDASGRLAFIHDADASTIVDFDAVEHTIREALGAYARRAPVLLCRDDPGAEFLLEDETPLRMQVEGRDCNLIDRRIVGSGWLDSPPKISPAIPRIVFASLKGGVGRSTALAVAASKRLGSDRFFLTESGCQNTAQSIFFWKTAFATLKRKISRIS
jgi:hypothetical protein